MADKLDLKPDVYKRWVDATLPFSADFLSSLGWIGKITIFDNNGDIIQTIESQNIQHAAYSQLPTIRTALKLFRTEDYQFSIVGQDPSSMEWNGVIALWACLNSPWDDKENRMTVHELLGRFDHFTRDQECRPALARAVKDILGE